MFGKRSVWYDPGKTGCDRCGAMRSLAKPTWFTFQLWCEKCLRETGVISR